MTKIILKRGKLSRVEETFITVKRLDMSPEDIAKELKRNVNQVKKYIQDHLSNGASEENKENLKSVIHVENTGTAFVMTEAEASKPSMTTPRADPPWIFRQPGTK